MLLLSINVLDYGVDNTGATVCTDGINKAICSCAEHGGGTVTIPAGTYLTGSIFLKSNINLLIDAGAVLSFVQDEDAFPIISSSWEGADRDVHASCIYADGQKNVSVTGRGTVNGNGQYWWARFRSKEIKAPRPKLICFQNCENVLIEGVTLTNSPSWTIHPFLCNNVTIRNVTIVNPADSPNTDGIDPESCQNVRISDCHIDVGDDCLVIKSGTEDAARKVPCENIAITNCTMVHGHGGVVIGSEMSGDVRNVVISNCIFDGTDRGIRLKSRRGRGGVVSDIRVSNIIMRSVICPFVMNLYYFCGDKGKDKYVWDKAPYPVTNETPLFKSVSFDNITARDVTACAGFLYGLAEQYVDDVTFSNVSVSMTDEAKPDVPAMMSGIEPMAKQGFFLGNCRNITFSNVSVKGCDGDIFHMESCENIKF